MTLTPLGRPDKSGGFFISQYSNGSYSHRMRVHFDKVTAGDPTMTYQVANGSETTVFQTWASLANIIKAKWFTDWTHQLVAIYLNTGADPNVSGYNLFTQQFGWAQPAAIACTGGTATSAVAAASEQIVNMHTTAGGRTRFQLIGLGGFAYAVPYTQGASGGDSTLAALVAYVTGANTGIRGKDGAKLTGSGHVTSGYQARLRRHYGQA